MGGEMSVSGSPSKDTLEEAQTGVAAVASMRAELQQVLERHRGESAETERLGLEVAQLLADLKEVQSSGVPTGSSDPTVHSILARGRDAEAKLAQARAAAAGSDQLAEQIAKAFTEEERKKAQETFAKGPKRMLVRLGFGGGDGYDADYRDSPAGRYELVELFPYFVQVKASLEAFFAENLSQVREKLSEDAATEPELLLAVTLPDGVEVNVRNQNSLELFYSECNQSLPRVSLRFVFKTDVANDSGASDEGTQAVQFSDQKPGQGGGASDRWNTGEMTLFRGAVSNWGRRWILVEKEIPGKTREQCRKFAQTAMGKEILQEVEGSQTRGVDLNMAEALNRFAATLKRQREHDLDDPGPSNHQRRRKF